jgi:GR25 family glycosyltransferase involved in LPS biosynthesis
MEQIARMVYINLDRRTDRKEAIEEEFRRMELTVERFPAIEKNPGMLGCHLSHIAVLKKARDLGVPNILIFEDDFQFVEEKDVVYSQLKQFFEQKIDYDVLFLAYNIFESSLVNELVSRTTNAQTAAGYLVNHRFYNTLIENLETAYPLLEKTNAHWMYLNDQCWKTLQKTHTFLFFNIRLGRQRPSYSDLSQRFMDHGV